MSFAGKVWRLLVGIKDGLTLLLLLLFFGVLFAILTARPGPAQVREGALLLNLDGVVVEERSPIDPFEALLAQEAPVREYPARELVRAIDAAATDERIKAVVLDLDLFLGGGQVHLTEIGEAIARVRAVEKPVYTFATLYTDDALLLSANATEAWMDPLGGAAISGPGAKNLYIGGLLDRLNVTTRVYKVGTYKSAVEPFTRTSMSPEARENAQALYSALWEEWQAYFRKARPRSEFLTYANDPANYILANDGDMAKAALSAGLVDKLGSRFAFEQKVASVVGEDDAESGGFAHTSLSPWLSDVGPFDITGGKIGVVTVAGPIVDGEAGPGTASGERISNLLNDALDDDLAGLVVRVDSPGGSMLASEEIRRAVLRHKAKGIPVAVSMANVAASGGYWVSTPADRIFAEPETITGSIGIFALLPTFEELANEYGVATDGVTTTPLTGQPDFIGGFNSETDQILQAGIEKGYRDFLARVAQARGFSLERADTIGQGRVWTGGMARQLGLVDQFGGLPEAIEWVAAEAELEEGGWHPVYLGEQIDTYDTLLRTLLFDEDAEARTDFAGHLADRQYAVLGQLKGQLDWLANARGIQAYCLECPAMGKKAVAPREPSVWGKLALLLGLS